MMSAAEQFEAMGIAPEYAAQLQLALQFLSLVPERELQVAIERVGRAESIGPILDPSAWQGGKIWENAAKMKRLLSAVLKVKAELPEPPPDDPIEAAGRELAARRRT